MIKCHSSKYLQAKKHCNEIKRNKFLRENPIVDTKKTR